jgi:hypothetical protein
MHGRDEKHNLVGKPDGERSLRRPRGIWKDNIRKNLRKTGRECELQC